VLILNLGYSHPVQFPVPKGISASVDKNSIKLAGIDKEELGHVAAAIRRLRRPEPYKGKGVKFAEERIQRKAGKTGTK
jgi:large subunit ribosomal protein L6